MTAGLCLALQGNGCLCVCTPSLVVKPKTKVAMSSSSQRQRSQNTKTSIRTLTQADNDPASGIVSKYQPIFVLKVQTKQFLRSGINPHASPRPNMISPIEDTISAALRTEPSGAAATLIHPFNAANSGGVLINDEFTSQALSNI